MIFYFLNENNTKTPGLNLKGRKFLIKTKENRKKREIKLFKK